jgi:hypothetical protein
MQVRYNIQEEHILQWPKVYWTNNDVENTTKKTEVISHKFDI